jgi:hypothetical protein
VLSRWSSMPWVVFAKVAAAGVVVIGAGEVQNDPEHAIFAPPRTR